MIDTVELFAGTGGLALGLQEAGFSHTALVERDRHSCDNLESNAAYVAAKDGIGWNVEQADVRTIDFSPYEGLVRVVAGGPPCQPFSLGGKGKAYDDSRDMFPEAVRAVREIKPEAFIFENVKGLLRKSFSTYFNYIILQLTYPEIVRSAAGTWQDHLALLERQHTSTGGMALKYNVAFRVLNAADYGIPQMRHRVFIVGFRSDINAQWAFPEGMYSQNALLYDQWVTGRYWDAHSMERPDCPFSQKQLDDIKAKNADLFAGKRPWRTVRDALRGLPEPYMEDGTPQNHRYHGTAKAYPGHTGSVMDMPSKTIKAGAHGVPGGENMLVLDSGAMRYYTVRESARIQTFPDGYVFRSSWTESMRQIGNAVPVYLARQVGHSVALQLQ